MTPKRSDFFLQLICLLFFCYNECITQTDEIGACGNFYRLTCSEWKSQKPDFESVWNRFVEASYKINRNVRNILEDDAFTSKAKTFYEACVNYLTQEDRYFINLKLMIEYFKGWPLVEDKWSGEGYEWIEEVAQVNKILGAHPVFKFHTGVDYKDTKKYSIYIEPGTLIFPQNILLKPQNYSRELKAYAQWILKSVRHLYPKRHISKRLKWEATKIVEFEMRLAKLIPSKSKIEKTTIEKLSKKTSVDFLNVMGILFAGTGIKIEQNDTVIVRNVEYFNNVLEFLRRSRPETIANYLIWSVIKSLSRDTTGYLHELNFSVDKTVLGITADVSRQTECAGKVIEHFSYAILPEYLKLYFDEFEIDNVENIVTNVKREFEKLLGRVSWISEGTRLLAIEKVRKIRYFVGYPRWARNNSLVQQVYENVSEFIELLHYTEWDLQLSISNDHLLNVVNLKNFKTENNLRLFGAAVDSILWPSNIFDVNSYYSVLQNSVFMPLGILQYPFYDKYRPSIYNYGALGALIGHELSHSLDTTGRQANINGIISKWWPARDVSDYQARTECFERLYGSDNILTVGENIADNVGLEISFSAYKNLDLEGVLLTEIDRKLFFLSYAEMWCEKSEVTGLFDDEHTNVEQRVNRAVLNSESFRECFGCRNISDICKLW